MTKSTPRLKNFGHGMEKKAMFVSRDKAGSKFLFVGIFLFNRDLYLCWISRKEG